MKRALFLLGLGLLLAPHASAAEVQRLGPRIEIVAGNATSFTYRELLPERVALDEASHLFHYRGCPQIRPGMPSLNPAAATLRGYKAHCPELRTYEYATRTEQRKPHDEHVVSVLFLGNSLTYFNEIPWMTGALGAHETRPLFVDAVTRSGAPLAQLWRETPARKRLWQEHWDYVVIQGGAGAAGPLFHRDEFNQFLRLFADEVRKSGATPLFYMVWSLDRPDEHAAASLAAARANGMRVVPAGLAMLDLIRRGRFKRFDWDGVHPDAFGAYLVACTVYSTIYGKPAPPAPYEFRSLAAKQEVADAALLEQHPTAVDARALRDAAWRAVQNVRTAANKP
jgi:hypothetical protein